MYKEEYKTKVTFWEKTLNKNVKNKVEEVCFRKYAPSRYYSGSSSVDSFLRKIYYKIIIDENLVEEEVLFYLEFINQMLPGGSNLFKVRRLKDKNFLFILNTKEIVGSTKIVFSLTAARYLQEFPSFVKEFYKNKSESFAENFIIFQNTHLISLEGQKYNNRQHMLRERDSSNISYEKFLSNWNSPHTSPIYGFFQSF